MAKARKIAGEDDARRCLNAAKLAGQEPRDWAREHGVDARSLHMWRMHLKHRDDQSARSEARRRRQVKAPAEPTCLGLVELVPVRRQAGGDEVVATPGANDLAASRATYTVEVAGARLTFGDDFSAAALRRVLEVLRSC